MKLMKLGTDRIGIAGEYRFESLQDVLKFTPRKDTYSYCDGDHKDNIEVTAILASGKSIELECEWHHADGSNHIPDYDKEAPSIGEQIADLDVRWLIFTKDVVNQNYEDCWEEYLAVTPPDWGKIRRRIEDAMRKTTSNADLFNIGQRLGVKLV